VISADVTVARLLEEHPELVEVLAGYHPHFKALRNRLLRRVMAPRVTIAQAAGMAGVPVQGLLAALRSAVDEVAPTEPSPPALSTEGRGTTDARSEGGRPAALTDVAEDRQVHIDVREDIRRGEEPLARIMAAVKTLAGEQVLVLRAPFEPIPLYDILGKRGFAHWAERHAADDWTASFYRPAAALESPAPIKGLATDSAGHIVLDVRGLEPPQPMVRVLEQIDHLSAGAELEVRHDRRPVFLYPQLDDRGFVHETDEPEPGLVRIRIRRGSA
jgi:uncharacterized protein (DUF2249 family)